jgi:2-polyprenyl-6-methoxyphenol hydroxylase-like FAD-dependent oxidoreductase
MAYQYIAQYLAEQIAVVPILHRFAASQESVSLRFRHKMASFEQTGDQVSAIIHDLDNNSEYSVEAKYMVACEGARGTTRRALGIARDKSGAIGYSADIVFRSPALAKKTGAEEAGRYTIITPENGMSFSPLTIDGRELYRMMLYAEPVQAAEEKVIDAIRYSLGDDVPFEVVSDVLHWVPRVTLAEKFHEGRVFLADDSAHTMPTAGGYGMNTGILDAADLGWKLDAMLRGWGGPFLLDSYCAERRPAARRTSEMASLVFKHFHVVGDEIKRFGPDLLKESEAGEVARKTIGDRLVNFFRKEFNALGGALGYRYEESPICIPDGSPAPEDLVDEYVQTSRPGHRAPHAWIRNGVSTLDLFGEKFTLIRSGGEDRHCIALQEAADAQGVPMNIVTLNDASIRALYPRNFTLVRPDGHVAWRGDVVDDSVQMIFDTVTGKVRA